MSGPKDMPDDRLRRPGRGKDGKPFKEGNTRDDGGYAVGRNRPPQEGQFRKSDGRKRGRRAKGAGNVDKFFERELARKITIREDGRERRVSKGQGVDMRLIANAGKGDNKAIEMVDQRRRRIAAEKEETAGRYHSLSDANILRQYLKEMSDEHGIDPDLFGDAPPTQGGGAEDD